MKGSTCRFAFITMCLAVFLAGVSPELQSAEITPKQSEALYQELMKYPEFKAADEALSAAYLKARATLDSNQQIQLRDEQRKWLKARDQAILSIGPGVDRGGATRLWKAVNFTANRTRTLVDNQHASATTVALRREFDQGVLELERLSREVAERLGTKGRKKLHDNYLSFRGKLWSTIDRSYPGIISTPADFSIKLPLYPKRAWRSANDAILQTRVAMVKQQTESLRAKLDTPGGDGLEHLASQNMLPYSEEFLRAIPVPRLDGIDVTKQTIPWNHPNFDIDLRGEKYRIGTIKNTVFVFDATTRLLIGSFDVNVSEINNNAGQRLDKISFFCKEKFIYCETGTFRNRHARIYLLPSCEEILGELGDGGYRQSVYGPIVDASGSVGIFRTQWGADSDFRSNGLEYLQKAHLVKNSLSRMKLSPSGSTSNTSDFLSKNPLIEKNFFIFESSPIEHLDKTERISGDEVSRVFDASEGELIPRLLYSDLVLERSPYEHEEDLQSGVIAVEIRDNSVLLHRNRSGELESVVLDFKSLKFNASEWCGPKFCATRVFNEDSPSREVRLFDSSGGDILLKGVPEEGGLGEQFGSRYLASIDRGRTNFLQIPSEGINEGCTIQSEFDRKLYDYSDKKNLVRFLPIGETMMVKPS